MPAVINADGLIAGRLASHVAKRLINGEKIVIVNAEKALITGDPQVLKAEYTARRKTGSQRKGPFYPRMPDRILRRAVRGMLPYQKPSGRAAFRRLSVYIGVPDKFKNSTLETVPLARKERIARFMTVGDISKHLGYNKKIE